MDFCLEVVNIVQQTEQAESFGQILRRRRKDVGLTQDQLAERCGGEPSKSYISQLETARKLQDGTTPLTPGIEIVDTLADALGEPRNYFRKLTGHRLVEDEQPIDRVGEEFSAALHRYRQLSERSKEFVKKQLRDTVDFLIESEQQPVVVSSPTIIPADQIDDGPLMPKPITLEQAKEHSRRRREAKK